jgi:RNA polymerase sigma-70 factor (ECF subfamily)
MLLTAPSVPLAAAETPGERLGRLYEAQHQRLYRLALRMARDAEEARDLVQETFLRLARRPGALPAGERDGEAFLVRVLVNLCRDRFRRLEVRGRGAARLDAPRSTRDGESAALAKDAVRRALSTLAPRRRAVVVLAELEERTTGEIASMLGVSKVTERWHLAAGRAALRRFFAEDLR